MYTCQDQTKDILVCFQQGFLRNIQYREIFNQVFLDNSLLRYVVNAYVKYPTILKRFVLQIQKRVGTSQKIRSLHTFPPPPPPPS